MVSITLNEQTAQELQQAIRNFLRAEARRAMQRETKAFRKLHFELWKTIPGEYAAVYQGKLIDYDSDQLALFLRVEIQYSGLTVLIRQVCSTPEEIIQAYSPKIEYA